VKSGDTGEKIAFEYTGNKGRWPELVTANPTLKDPTYGLRIYAGQTIKLPATWGAPSTPVVTPVSTPATPGGPAAVATSDKYVVKSGDTGEKIALAFTGAKGRWPELVTANPTLKDPTYGLRIYAGQTIKLPPSWIQQAVTSGRRWVV
jgi:LysM repeat protein